MTRKLTQRVTVSKEQMTEEQQAEALQAGATVHEGWERRVAPAGQMIVYMAEIGWWGVARIGQPGRIARRRSIAAAVSLAARLINQPLA